MADNLAPAGSGGGATIQQFSVFHPYPLQVGHKIFIESGPRRGDWEVIGLSDRKVKLRCPFFPAARWSGTVFVIWSRNAEAFGPIRIEPSFCFPKWETSSA